MRVEWIHIFSHGSEAGQAGVTILVPSNFSHECREMYVDEEGCIVCIGVGTGRQEVIIVGVYAPSVDNVTVKCNFLSELRETLLDFATHRTVLCGDLNIKLGSLDTNNTNFRVTGAATKMQDLLDEFSLEDAWRAQHPTTRKYTWKRLNPLQQSRIDYTFVSDVFLSNEVPSKNSHRCRSVK